MEDLKFCYERGFEPAPGTQSAVAYKSKYWDKGYIIKIFFINGTATQKANMVSVVDEMLKPLSLDYKEVKTKEESDIRISFNYGHGSYSYLGTDCKFISKDKETLNIGWDGRDVMYHEFGHALNLSHEHQNPVGGIVWNEAQVIKDLSGPPNNWSLAQIRNNVLNKIPASAVDATNLDLDSVMLYYFPASWTIGGFSTNDNPYPSSTDKAFLLTKYGKSAGDEIAPSITLNGDQNIILQRGEQYIELGAKAIDNVDGDITKNILILGSVDTTKVGTHHIIYKVTDKAGNSSQIIRNILVKDINVKEFLKKLFVSKNMLNRITEEQLVVIGNELKIEVSVDDLKRDTVDKIWKALQE